MAVFKIPNPQWDGLTPEEEYLPISQIGVQQFPDAPEDGKMYNRKNGNWVECPAHPIPTLESVPGEDTLTYIVEGVTYTFRIGDEVRYYDSEKEEYVFYKLYDLADSKADWKIAGSGGGVANETLVLSLTSNQGSDVNLEGVKINIKYLDNTTVLTWSGVPLTTSIPINVSYTIECEAIEGYKTPETQEFTAIAGNTRTINLEYQTTLTTITVTSNQSQPDSALNGLKLTLSYGQTSKELNWTNTPQNVNIPTGTEYTITGEAVEGYKTPNPLSQIAEGTSGTATLTYNTTVLSITVTSNQSDALSALTVTVAFDSKSENLQFSGKETKSINIPTGSEFTITFPEISNYTKPSTVTDTATGASMSKSGEYGSTKLTVTRASNQSEGLGDSTATLAYSSSSTPINFTNSSTSETVMLPLGVSYTVTFSEVTGYKTPDVVSGTTSQASESVSGTYQSEFLTVNVSGASGYTITVSGQGTQTTASKVYKIPFGTSYTISASDVKGYNTPANQSFTANQVSRTVAMTYTKIANGVYIYDNEGKLTATGSWNTSNNSKAVGVAVVSDNCSFVIDKTNSNSGIAWGGYGTDIPNLDNITDSSQAKLDYDGKSNTDKIIASLGSSTSNAAGWCRSKSITVNGSVRYGYLPSLGEWQTAYNNKSVIDSALSTIGGTAMLTGYHWSSTEYSSDVAWYLLWSSGNVSNFTKGSDDTYCRPWFEL